MCLSVKNLILGIKKGAKAPRVNKDADVSNAKCFVCNNVGHLSYNCTMKDKEEKPGRNVRKSGEKTCFVCKKPGHLSYECTQKQSE